jgi:lysophospholipase L1-like esterase
VLSLSVLWIIAAMSDGDMAGVCSLKPASVERGQGPDLAPKSLRAFMRAMAAKGAAIDDPCVEIHDQEPRCACGRTTLEPFFAALDASAAQHRRTGIVAIGNSLIAADGITDVVRARLVERFADGGRGLLLADRLGPQGPRARTAGSAHGWRVESCASGDLATVPFGAAGVQHVSEGRASSRFTLRGADEVTVFWVDRAGGPTLSWRVDDGPWQALARGRGARASALPVDPSARAVTLRTDGAGAVVQGVAVDRGGGGVVLDVLGVPSSDATLWLRPDERTFSMQLAQRAPSLVMVMLGGNEAKRISWGRSTRASIVRDLRALVKRVRAATEAACLVIGPIDAIVGPDADDPWRQRPTLAHVIAVERATALDEGCAFFDLYAAMGGRGSLKRLNEAGALHDDLVHPRGRGLDMLGQLIADALLRAYARSPIPTEPRRTEGGGP